jgi:isoquinoline 1-oxidoreductase beta subunit
MAANEIFVDRLAAAHGADDIQFRLDQLAIPVPPPSPATAAVRAAATRCLEKVQDTRAAWGAAPAGHAYGVAMHAEYRSAVAYLVEIDASDPADPRLVRAFAAVDVGVPINPKGLEAQIQGVLIDGWSVMIRAANHLEDGAIVEGSYSDFLWARMDETPLTVDVYVFSKEETGGDTPGGAGELGLPPASAACVNAYARATGWPGGNSYRFPILEFLPS